MRRAAIGAVAVLALACASVGAVTAADTLGATLYVRGQSLVIEDAPQPVQVGLTNRSTVALAGTITVSGDGYTLATDTLGTIPPSQTGVTELAAIGPGPATITAHLLPTGTVPAGQEPVGLDLSLTIRHRTPVEQVIHDVGPYWPVMLAALVLVLVVIRAEAWRFRVMKSPRKYLRRK